MMSGADIRRSYLNFFEERNHVVVPSSSLVPNNDPTLMFTNSGMAQFKNNFTGVDKSLSRAASSQKCVRAGGKHNDLDNVGRTARHHTFFEMLGNFSFGDYFKEEAITWGWQWVTEDLNIDPSRLCVTIYHDDDEAFNIWHKKVGLAEKDIIRIATSDNFWTMGDTGPCGPCSEIFYDHGPEVWGDRPGTPEEDGDRFMEIWNLVFTQFDLQQNGDKVPLPNKNIDTGAGLERVMAVAQGVHSNYDTDIFQILIGAAAQQAGVTYREHDETDVALRVIADHLRCMSFLIVDGVMPGNEGRGYVLRRIMRRAMRYVHMLGIEKPFIYNLMPTLVQVMGEAYPELTRGASMAADVIKLEEERFGRTLKQGMKLLGEESSDLKEGDSLSGDIAFKLYDTFGFPLDLTQDALRNRGVNVDISGFQHNMAEQKARARAAHKGSGDAALEEVWFDVQEEHGTTEFLGYSLLETEAEALAVVQKGSTVKCVGNGEKAIVVVNQTPFYGESGGQVGDTGTISWQDGQAKVTNTTKVLDGVFLHHIEVTKGILNVGENLTLKVDVERRAQITRNHSATHLLHAALQNILGDHVFQKGSLQDADKTRFDISHPKAITAEQQAEIEAYVNKAIWQNLPVETRVMGKEEALELGAMALFGEKYGDEVRVVTMGEDKTMVSVELCGGTHVSNTGEIGLFKIASESALAAGVRRVEATTYLPAWQAFRSSEEMLKETASVLNMKPTEVPTRVLELQKEIKKLKQELKQAKRSSGGASVGDLASKAEQVGSVTFVAAEVADVDVNELRELVDGLKNKLGSGVIVLATKQGPKTMLVAGVTQDLTTTYKAGDLVNTAAAPLGGKGGGRPDFAQAGAGSGDIGLAFGAVKQQLGV
ncbi:MAG: alanine--tRNA ligase [Alphaproteobacteria bacterium]|nr:alanine--tRNA ligase [Alphaproteobacteria bacterium]MDD9919221.1 alanine--tRNA ligase [Alphaproteobacteria bacterium]